MKIYLDSEFKCHINNPNDEYISIETNVFNNKCNTYIEGYRYIPAGKSWTRSDGVIFHGEMITPWKDYNELDLAQREYERQKLAMYEEALKIMGVEV